MPLEIGTSPAIIFRKVVFPDPDLPTTKIFSPYAIFKFKLSIIFLPSIEYVTSLK